MATIFLGLGSNIGDREGYIRRAIKKLEENSVAVQKTSSIIETDPVGGPQQGKFLNAVIKADTDLPPKDLLTLLKNIEKQLGRQKTVVNGPREIDLDILLYDEINMQTPQLTIPHPRMLERAFVMDPLREIEPVLAQKLKHEDH